MDRIKLEGLEVEVRDTVAVPSPWGGGTVQQYRVKVEAPEGDYETFAWGSIADHAEGKLDHEGIGYMVLGELLSAAYDPDEFFRMATEGKGWTAARQRAIEILTVIESAERLLPALERNADRINEEA